MLFLAAAAAMAQNVYVGGSYVDDEGWTKACYWVNGVRHELDGVAVDAITAVDGKVYAAGYWQDFSYEPLQTKYCYWVDGKRYDLPGCSIIRSICVDNGNVYITGIKLNDEEDWNPENGYWVNGVYCPPPSNGSVFALAALNGVVYTAGYYDDGDTYYACYWVNGILRELPNSNQLAAYGIEVIDGRIYVGAAGGSRAACYWINNVQYMILQPEEVTISTVFSVFGGDVYMASEKSYWINGIRHDLPEETQTLLDSGKNEFSGRQCIFGGRVYIAGYAQGKDYNNQTQRIAYYWVDGRLYYLNGDSALSIFVTEE